MAVEVKADLKCGWCMTGDHERCRAQRPPLEGWLDRPCTCPCPKPPIVTHNPSSATLG